MRYLLICFLLVLGACQTTTGEIAKDRIYGVVSTTQENLTDASIDYICSRAPVGIIRKKFWKHPVTTQNWVQFCAFHMHKDVGI